MKNTLNLDGTNCHFEQLEDIECKDSRPLMLVLFNLTLPYFLLYNM